MACSKIDRDNILDPKNTSSKSESIVLLEAFINTNTGAPPYNYYALDAISSLKEIYKDRLIVCEYHWNTKTIEYSDTLTVLHAEQHYFDYTTNYTLPRNTGVPDLFINGADNRVQGASNSDNVISRVEGFASDLLEEEGQFTIEADINVAGRVVSGSYRVAMLGNERSQELFMRILLTYDSGETGSYTVGKILLLDPMGRIKAGEFVEKSFIIEEIASPIEKIVFILMDENGFDVLYAIEKEI